MRWSIIRLIWLRELRDQLRDRRTVFMIAVLPIVIYPVAGFGVLYLARAFLGQQSVVGVAGLDNLRPWRPRPVEVSVPRGLSWLSCTPAPGCPGGLPARLAGAVALDLAPVVDIGPGQALAPLGFTPPPPGCPAAGGERAAVVAGLVLGQPRRDWPGLLEERGPPAFAARYLSARPQPRMVLEPIAGALGPPAAPGGLPAGVDRTLLEQRKVDVILVVPPGFQQTLAATGRADVYLLWRDGDDSSRLVNDRVTAILGRWKRELKQVRLTRQGLPSDFDEALRIHDPQREQAGKQSQRDLFALLVRIFPFILVMWSLAGALYPAVDLCAGEKERGTMETLLISPAGRAEIVWGKFLTIWVFSAATALLNLLSMALTTWQAAGALPEATFSPWALFWGVVLLLPLSAFFSAVCLAVGAYARSSKEGQYYLMPLFLITMPLIFLTLAPGVELNPFYSMVPVTGVALLLQQLMSTQAPDRRPWLYFVPVLAPMVIYSWLALRWAIAQFQREEVLFREAERLDLGLWLRKLLREKEALPSAGEAFFCFGLILGLRWLSLGFGTQWSLLTRTSISQLAFVATPPLFMALLLTTRPLRGLALRRPPWWAWPAAVLLAVAVVPPLVELTSVVLAQLPALKSLLEEHPLTRELKQSAARAPAAYFLVLVVLPGLCEELAFRGFVLSGLRRAFRPWTAILLGAFLFSLYQMNVFQFATHFLLGAVLGLLVLRSGSVLPAMLFRLVYNSLLIAPALLEEGAMGALTEAGPWRLALAAGGAVLAAGGLWALWRLGPREEGP